MNSITRTIPHPSPVRFTFLSFVPILSLLLFVLAASPAAAGVLYYEDFEDGGPDWGADNGVWEIGAPCDPPGAFEGLQAAGTVLCAEYPRYTDSRLISPPIDLPLTGTDEEIRLRFEQYFRLSGGDAGNVHVQVRNPDETWGAWVDLGYSAIQSSDWTHQDFDLTAYAGETVRIGFYHFENNDGYQARGWFIDAVTVWSGIPIFDNPTSFESGWGDWHASRGIWTIGAEPTAPDGASAAGTVLGDSYLRYTDSILVSPTVQLPAAGPDEEVHLRFEQTFSLSGGDSGSVYIKARAPDGSWGGWVNLGYSAIHSSDWTHQAFDLTDYAGKAVRIGFFHAENDDGYQSTGWILDQVSIWSGVPVFENPTSFESGWGDWHASRGIWTIGAEPTAPEGTAAAGTVLGDSYLRYTDSILVSPTVQLPVAGPDEEVHLRFEQLFSLSGGDSGSVYIKARAPDGSWGGWVNLGYSAIHSSDWTHQAFDLTDYAGKAVRIGFFHAENDDGYQSTGWIIDQVSIWSGVPVFENPTSFESGWGDWHASRGIWTIGAESTAPEGASAAGTVLGDSYLRYTDSILVSPTVQLPATGADEEVRLRFEQTFSLSGGDAGYVYIRERAPDGSWSAWTNIGDSAIHTSDWSRQDFDLTAYAGKTVRIGFFHAENDDGYQSSGWIIDQVTIWSGIPDFQDPTGFENGWEDWHASRGVWEIGVPTSGPSAAHGCDSVAATQLGGSVPRYTDSRLVSPTVQLPVPGGGEALELRFWQWFSYSGGDARYVQIRELLAGGTWGAWQTLWSAGGGSSGWSEQVIDLSLYAGKTVRLAFYHAENDDGYQGAGWYIDDVTLNASWDGDDGDDVPDACDNCVAITNPDQANADGDALGDLCDPCINDALDDIDGDGYCADVDTCPTIYNPDQNPTACDFSNPLDGTEPNVEELDWDEPGSEIGHSVAAAGDLDGDGNRDLIAGAPGYTPEAGRERAGGAVVYLGDGDETERARPDIVFVGELGDDRAGVAVSGDFDFDHDGTPDLMIGAEQMDRSDGDGDPTNDPATGNGRVYVIYFDPAEYDLDSDGTPDYEQGLTASVDLADVGTAISGVIYTGEALGDMAGFSVDGGGLMNADTLDDLVIGAPGADPDGRTDAGVAYVLFGTDPAPMGTLSLSDVGTLLEGVYYKGGAAGDELGYSVSFPGDVVGTVGDDLGLGAPGAGTIAPGAGTGYFLQGNELFRDISEINDTGDDRGDSNTVGVQIAGTQDGERLGSSIAGAGDNLVNGEADILMGAPGYDRGADLNTGRVVQTASRLSTGFLLADDIGAPVNDPASVPGVIYLGAAAGDRVGASVAGLGDVTGDGFDDAAFGAPEADVDGTSNAGVVYVVPGYVPPTFHLGTIDLGQGFPGTRYLGTEPDGLAGTSIAGLGDFSDDGENDFAVGAPGANSLMGVVYVILDTPCGSLDSDLDGVLDCEDNCVAVGNPGQVDLDGDHVGDLCDNCPGLQAVSQVDTDGDGYGDLCDNCIETFNPSQTETDGDGVGEACDENPLYTVSPDENDQADFAKIQDAIAGASQSGATIRVLGKTEAYTENLVIDHDQVFTIEGMPGGSGERVVIDGGGGTALEILSTLGTRPMRLSHLTLRGRNGLVVGGGGQLIDSDLFDVVFEDIEGGLDSTAVKLIGGLHEAEEVVMESNVRHGFDVSLAADLSLRRSTFDGLTGTVLRLDGSALVENVLIAHCNRGLDLLFTDSILDLRHSTVADCTGPAVENLGGLVTIAHTIAWNNNGGDDLVGVSDCLAVSWSDLGDCTCDGENSTFCLNPQFATPEYTLVDTSPALDYGPDPSIYDGTPCLDRSGGARLKDNEGDGLATVDVGAFEHRKALAPEAVTGLQWTDGQTLVWDSVPTASLYHVYRDDVATLGYDDFGSCDATLDPVVTETLSDARVPVPGQVWFYVITADDGLSEGSQGDGTCAERSNFASNTCPP